MIFFLTYISHTYETIIPLCRVSINIFSTIVKKLENKIIHSNRITWNILKAIANNQNALVSEGFKNSQFNLKIFKINAMLVGKVTKNKKLERYEVRNSRVKKPIFSKNVLNFL